MKSITIGISRPGDADGLPLLPGTDYVSRCANFPEVTFSVKCKQVEFLDNVKNLRYTNVSPASANAAICFFTSLISDVFKDLKYLTVDTADTDPLHVRLITTPMELAQLPFEFAPFPWDLTWKGQPSLPDPKDIPVLLADPVREITLTREVLQETQARYEWPKQPRILFAWAQPGAEEDEDKKVPHEEHKKALIDSLAPLARPKKDKPLPEPDTDPFLTELPNASIKLIKQAITKGITENKPYSHIHLLAHGGQKSSSAGDIFLLVLCDDDPDLKIAARVDGKKLSEAIISGDKKFIPVVVTLSACDSANTGSVLVPTGSLVYQLHNAGIPCVFASQFPLTQEGSVEMVRSLYTDFTKGCDPRSALYHVRTILRKNGTHDWASLVAYARFPDDINVQAYAIWLKILFASMETTGKWVEHVVNFKDAIGKDEGIFAQVTDRLDHSINELSGLLKPGTLESKLSTEALRSEHLGLLGSAYKRKAEFLYRLVGFYPEKEKDYINRSIGALRLAKDFYYASYDTDLNNHWTTMQYLSLKIVLGEFSEDDKGLWEHIFFVTKSKEKKEKDIPASQNKLWAWGTLAELYLIKPMTLAKDSWGAEMQLSLAEGKNYSKLIQDSGNSDVIESTKRQLDRYITWWPNMFKSESMSQLKAMATEIRKELPSPESLLQKPQGQPS